METALLVLLVETADEQRGGKLLRDGESDCPPAHLRRAEDFIAPNLSTPLSLADIAGAAGAPVRTLSRAFRKRHGMSPMGWLRQQRLEGPQRALFAADPERDTVTDIATGFGFYELGRFAARYRAEFGENPSETLRR